MAPLTIAGVQLDVQLGEKQSNLRRIEARLHETSAQGAMLTILPECVVTGYCFDSLDEALPLAEPLPGPSSERIAQLCRQLDIFCIFGLLERDGRRLFNAAALVGPQGLVATYRKVHLPHLGVDRFVTPGDRPFAVHRAGALNVGMNICYDGAFPEAARVLALAGADLIALPTNWPPGAECFAQHVINARAMENGVYFAAVNRIGRERGFQFIGQSRICDPDGNTMAVADEREPAVLYARIDPMLARNKRRVRVPGKHWIDRFADRRPEMYGPIVDPKRDRGQ